MPTFDGATGRVYYKAWRVPAPRTAALVFLHGFGEHSGLYHRLGNALNGAGIELWALDEIGHANAELEHPAVVFIAEGLGDDAGFVKDGPEEVGAAGIVVPDAGGAVARVGADQDHLHTLAEIVRQCSH